MYVEQDESPPWSFAVLLAVMVLAGSNHLSLCTGWAVASSATHGVDLVAKNFPELPYSWRPTTCSRSDREARGIEEEMRSELGIEAPSIRSEQFQNPAYHLDSNGTTPLKLRGLMATAKIRAGSKIMSVPRRAILSSKTSHCVPIDKVVQAVQDDEAAMVFLQTEQAIMEIIIMCELSIPDSRWRKYFASLSEPPSHETQWSLDVLRELIPSHGRPAQDGSRAERLGLEQGLARLGLPMLQQDVIKVYFESLDAEVFQKLRNIFPAHIYTLERYRMASGIRNRWFNIVESGTKYRAVVPMLDLGNHRHAFGQQGTNL